MEPVPAGCLHPRRILSQVVAGVRDYGNRMGIPTLNGTVWFDRDYVGNPLVYCGCVGVMPRDRIHGEPCAGDRIIVLGGRTGRDGIHGATFSSSELTDTHADEFSHAVQIGNPVTEKTLHDAILAARDSTQGCLYSAITDCGAGGFSSAVGEMGETLGAEVHLERAPLKYQGLTPTEIWISEAQDAWCWPYRRTTSNHSRRSAAFTTSRSVTSVISEPKMRSSSCAIDRVEVGRLPMDFLHEGRPDSEREATWSPPEPAATPSLSAPSPPSTAEALLALLAHPNIASKHWIIRQYDHEVQGAIGDQAARRPAQRGARRTRAVIQPVRGERTGAGHRQRAGHWLQRRSVSHGAGRNRRVRAQPRVRRHRPAAHRDPRQLLLAELRRAGTARRSRAGGDGLLRRRRWRTARRSSPARTRSTTSSSPTTGETIRIPPTLLISGIGLVRRHRSLRDHGCQGGRGRADPRGSP